MCTMKEEFSSMSHWVLTMSTGGGELTNMEELTGLPNLLNRNTRFYLLNTGTSAITKLAGKA